LNRRSALSVTLAVVLGFGALFANGGQAFAKTLSDLQKEQSNIIDKQSNVMQSIGDKNNQISEIIDRQSVLEAEMKKIELQIVDTDNKINEKQQEIEDTEAEIDRLKVEIEDLKVRIEKRNEILRERARNIQINGGSVKYLDVLLGAESFGDFIDRIAAVSALVRADKDIMEEQKRDKEMLESTQDEVEKKLASLNGMMQELQNLKDDLKEQNAKKEQIMKELEAQKKHAEHEKMDLEEEAEILKGQEAALKMAIQMEKTRIAEAEKRAREEAARKAREEEERKAREQAAKLAAANNQSSGNGSDSSSSGNSTANTPPVSSGIFSRPSIGYISSGFGGRSMGNHFGVDIAASGNVPIVAAADGVVNRSYYSPSYGNVVFVVHYIEGQTYETVYAHMRSRSISDGAQVSKGQVLGYMGNTGHSYGQHLHFELHVGLWNNGKSNAVDPRRYISF